jgi:hypothetical protein
VRLAEFRYNPGLNIRKAVDDRLRLLGLPYMPHDKNPLDQLSRILTALGKNPDQVAEALRSSKCGGKRYGNFPSPVIRYVYRYFDDGTLELVYSVVPTAPALVSKLYLYRLDGSREEVCLPAAIREFLDLFDQGAYPDLELNQ